MVFLFHITFDFDLFDLMRYVDGKQSYVHVGTVKYLTKPFLGKPHTGGLPVLSSILSQVTDNLLFLKSAEDGNYFPRKNMPNARIDRRTCLRSLHAADPATAPGVKYE